MISVKYIDLDKNLYENIFKDLEGQKTLFIFPTFSNKTKAQLYYQQNINNFDSEFWVISELKDQIFNVNKPLIKEEKRTISFFLSLSDENKKYFKINDYPQSITFALEFFTFFEELNDELVSENMIFDLFMNSFSYKEWKSTTLEKLISVKNDYQKFLNQKGFNDKIFIQKFENIATQFLDRFTHIAIANQFYFTNLEKNIYHQLSEELQVTLFVQQPKSIFDDETLSNTLEINAEHVLSILKQKEISCYIAPDSSSMFLHSLDLAKKFQINNFIDFNFEDQPYYHYLSENKFHKTQKKSVIHTNIYKFLTHIESILLGIKKVDRLHLIPIQIFLDAILDNNFIQYFQLENQDYHDLKKFVFSKIDAGYKFFDLELTFCNENFLPKFFHIFVDFIIKLKNIEVDKLENLFFEDDFLQLKRMTSDEEKQFFLKYFYEIFEDFLILEKSFSHGNWDLIFDKKSNYEKSGLVIRFFLTYLKSRNYQVAKNTNDQKIKITRLQDSRNNYYKDLIILNLNENILPATRKIPYLLSDFERKTLNLKTYDDIKSRDKYYFYQLLCQNESVHLFSIQNEENDIDISSFVEELFTKKICNRIELPNVSSYAINQKSIDSSISYNNYMQNYITTFEERQINLPSVEFLSIPFSDNDFDGQELRLSPSSWNNLRDNPFEYYLKNVLYLRQKKVKIDQDYSTALIGDFAHDIINTMWNKYLIRFDYQIPANFYSKMQLNDVLDNTINRFKNSNEFKFKVPQNYSDTYFNEIFVPILRESVKSFFRNLVKTTDMKDFYPIPEKKYMSKNEKRDKVIFDLPNIPLQVSVHGKADLRLETDKRKIIIDYKTAKLNYDNNKKYKDQLGLYEFIYYLFEENETQVESAIYYISSKYLKKPERNFTPDFIDKIKTQVEDVTQNGFMIPLKKSKYETIELTRRELVKAILNNGE